MKKSLLDKVVFLFLILTFLLSITGCHADSSFSKAAIRVVTPTDYAVDEKLIFPYSQGRALIVLAQQDKPFVFIDEKGTMLPTHYDFAYSFKTDGKALVQNDDEWFYINTDGQKTEDAQAPTPLKTVTEIYDNGNGSFGVQTPEGVALTQPVFSFISSLNEEWNYAELENGAHKKVMIDQNGTVLVTLPDDCLDAYNLGEVIRCRYKIEGSNLSYYKLVDLKGKVLTRGRYTGIGNFEDGLAPIVADGRIGLIASDGTEVVSPTLPQDMAISFDNMTPAYGEGKILVTPNGRLVILEVTLS